jgi:hypothetical protein
MSRAPGREAEPADGGPWLDPADARPALVLFADGVEPAHEAACAAGVVGGIVAAPAALPAWRPLARRHAVALLGRDQAVPEADGVHLPASAEVAAVRARLGRGSIIGVGCGLSRHAAMVAGEAGADYVLFGDLDRAPAADDELFELVAWWSSLFVIPCAAAGSLDAAASRALLAAGADLLAVRQPAVGVVDALREAVARPPP